MAGRFAARHQARRGVARSGAVAGADLCEGDHEISLVLADLTREPFRQFELQTCMVAELDTATALSAAELCAKHNLATADAIVYATALAHDADVLTCDRHFENLPGVLFVLKPSG
jgi:predicted nucleic acid-binding protein